MTSPPDLTIRLACDADIERLIEMLTLGALQAGSEDPSDLEPYRRALMEISTEQRNQLLVAEHGGEVVAMCQVFAVRHFHRQGGLCAEIEAVHVHPDYRRTDIGSSLITHAVGIARSWGCYRVQLTSNKNRTDAHRFYERLGFIATHEGFKLLLTEG